MYLFTKKMKALTLIVGAASGLLVSSCKDNEDKAINSQEVKVATQSANMPAKNDKNNKENKLTQIWPKLTMDVTKDAAIEAKVATLVNQMTLAQKVAQMIQPEIRDITVEDMRKYGFGSYLNGGGAFPNNDKHASANDWIALAESLYQASIDDSVDGIAIPTMWGTDAVHGHNNVIGATLFPHNIGLGAMRDADLVEKIAQATAEEVRVTGIDWVFAPTVAVVRNDRWGRTYEGYSEDPEIVKSYAAAIVKGLQGRATQDFLTDKHVISTVKHFLGDGGTKDGDDQGNNLASEQDLFSIHGQGYVSGLSAGAQTVMASFNSWHGKKNHGNKYLLTDVLKDRMGFDGLVVGDWNGHGQVKGCTNDSCPQAVNAGLDIFMVPGKDWKALYENTIKQVNAGDIPLARINDAVTRILRVKMRAGLFTAPSPAKRSLSGKTQIIGSAKHRDIARQAVRESLVLLKNKDNILPLSTNQHILVTGDGADNIGKQAGGWTITWQGTGNVNADFPKATSIYQGIYNKVTKAGGSVELSSDASFKQKPDVAIVVFGEQPYAEGNGDVDNLAFERGNKKSLALLKALQAKHIPVVSLFLSGRPMWVNAEINASNAFVAAWLPGSEGEGIADVILKKANGEVDHDFVGKLSFSWPKDAEQTQVNRFDKNYQPLLPYGFGLRYGDDNVLADNLNEKEAVENKVLPSLNLFSAPWRMGFYQQNTLQLITSNQQSSANIEYRTVDHLIQEDARLLHFIGKTPASFEINDNFPFDLRGYEQAKAKLSFNVFLDKALSSSVTLSMRCEQACESAIDITDLLKKKPLKAWQAVTVDLACFANKGATMDKIFAPFVLSSSNGVTLRFSTVQIVPAKSEDKSADIACH